MEQIRKRIPKEYKVGGQRVEVRMVGRCENNCIGMEFLPAPTNTNQLK